jgi:hypothetical protein
MSLKQWMKEISKWNTLWLVVQPKYRSNNKKLPLRTWVIIGTIW